jgi:hypothetical protein
MKKISTLLTTISFFATNISSAYAQGDCAPGTAGCTGTAVLPTVVPFTNFGNLVTNILQVIMFVAGLFFFIYLLLGGIQWITSGGDKAGTQAARDRITAAFIGLVIVVGAFAITLIVEKVFGIQILSGFKFRPADNIVGK